MREQLFRKLARENYMITSTGIKPVVYTVKRFSGLRKLEAGNFIINSMEEE